MIKRFLWGGFIGVLFFGLTACSFPSSEDRLAGVGVLQMAEQSQLDEISTADWEEFVSDYGYKFKYPLGQKFFIARSTGYNDSVLKPGEKIEAIATGVSDDYYVYFIPEGGFYSSQYQFVINENGKDLPEEELMFNYRLRKEIEFAGRPALLEKYDNEHVFIRFKDLHNFRIQVFVNSDYKDIGWAQLERVLETFEFVE